MPRRSNLFQDVVGIITSHMAEGATVEESAELENRVTGKKREVDVVITTEAGGHTVIISVEASATKRPATVEWVERMIGKHADLPTNKLLLVSENGFRDQARAYADAKGVAAIAPENLASDDPAFEVVNHLRSIWPKVISLTPRGVRLVVRRPRTDDVVRFKAEHDHIIFLDDGQEIGTLLEVMQAFIQANMLAIAEQIGLQDSADDMTSEFLLGVGPPWIIKIDGAEHRLYVRDDSGEEPELHVVEEMHVRGQAAIQVSEISLEHRRLGDVTYAFGEGSVAGRDALVLFTESEEGGKATIRIRPISD